MPKNYPAFIIDRCREYVDGISYDYIACTDKTVGFVVRAYSVRRTAAEPINAYINSFPPKDVEIRFYVMNFETISVVLEIVSFLQSPVLDLQERGRIKSLLKKAARKYMAYITHNESPDYKDGVSLANQIKAIEDVLHTAEGQREHIASYMGKENAEHYTKCIDAALKSLKSLKKFQEVAQ